MPNPVASGLPNPAAYDTSEAGVVFDELTRLMWQGAFGDMASSNPGTAQAQAVDYCDALAVADYHDWRLPSRIELVSLLDYTALDAPPTIDQAAFPGTPTTGLFLTSSMVLNGQSDHWRVGFGNKEVVYLIGAPYHARCVRGEPFVPDYELGAVDLEGTVADRTTGLVWEQAASAERLEWQQATTRCADSTLAGFDDWRVPSMNELQLVVDDSYANPSADSTLFPTSGEDTFWTTPQPATGLSGRTISFFYGNTESSNASGTAQLRCVR